MEVGKRNAFASQFLNRRIPAQRVGPGQLFNQTPICVIHVDQNDVGFLIRGIGDDKAGTKENDEKKEETNCPFTKPTNTIFFCGHT